MAGIKIIGLGRSRGNKIFTNEEMSQIVDTSDEWIQSKTGIKSRYFAEKNSNADLAVQAAEIAIEQSGIDRKEIGVCIVSTFTPDDFTPAVSCNVSGRLGLSKETMAFDLNGACTGFIFGCNVANGLLSTGNGKYALVIGSEKISPLLDMSNRGTCVLFGDGAGAAVLEYSDEGEFVFYGGCESNKDILYCARDGEGIQMSGQEVYRFAVSKVPECINSTLKKAGYGEDDIDYFVCHQANERIIDNAARRISKDKKKFPKNLYTYGNTSAASIPILLAEMFEAGDFDKERKIICTGFGAGLTYASMYIKMEGQR